MEKREEWIDFAKGIAILLVVIGHVNLGFLQANMFQPQQELMKYLHFTIFSFHMPLFFMISGYLYAKTWKINDLKDYKYNITKKIINLGIPYIVFSILQGFIKIIMSKSVNGEITINDIVKIPIKPFNQFWYIYALIGIFIFVALLDLAVRNNFIVCGILFVGIVFIYYLKFPIPMINYIFNYSLYFYLGKIIYNYNAILKSKILLIASIIIYMVLNGFDFHNMDIKFNVYNELFIGILLAATGSYFILFITRNLKKNKTVCYLGKMSFQIYLLHIIFGSGIRVVLIKMHINNIVIHYIVGITLGIIAPILIYKVASKVKILDFLFFPYKNLKTSKKEIQLNI